MAIPAQMYPWGVMENSCGLNNLYFVQKSHQEGQELMFPPKDRDDHHSVFSYQGDEIDLLINAQVT